MCVRRTGAAINRMPEGSILGSELNAIRDSSHRTIVRLPLANWKADFGGFVFHIVKWTRHANLDHLQFADVSGQRREKKNEIGPRCIGDVEVD